MSLKKQSIIFFFFGFNLINMSYAALHDPTKPIISPLVHESSADEDDFNLQSILIGPMRRLAMINGQIVGTGSNIQGARVLAIDKNHVVLFYAGHRKILYLFGKRLWKTH
ncbi:hypothetical protein DGG96_12045 [Legionella qingyii]|uniref:MSHA biogenesis protein MshK n=1 Tax=Legionella qingyii TaxID=2184757 RepID=A0A317U3D9_9GAMM|nr:hypothetical protein [Legionella qingyii]PWY55357.1 hypothetical protein DGG96_12045 [Legionella qingyii]RUR21243.1 hypothetical protein ELY20_13130 [Legionella qingyii]RUR23966.1 hypothetical protein ELY16_12185 [Legionella qingyii]